MAVSTNPDLGEVVLDLPTVEDPFDPSIEDVYAALDESCNTTCHSPAWGAMCEQKLRAMGLEFLWKSMPFVFVSCDGAHVKGQLESYEIDSNTSTPLLLSLYAQILLGVAKDLVHGTCLITDHGTQREIQLYKCKRTGLLLSI